MDQRNDNPWVTEKMAVLDPASGWRPDSDRGLSRMYARDAVHRRGKRRWVWSAGMASAACLMLLALAGSQSCAWGACLVSGSISLLPASIAAPPETSFKISGSPSAPITIEIYSDYECPYCAKYFSEAVPLLVAQYVQTGKVRLVHRDFPLPQHTWAKLAARYANAAGELGQYDAAVNQIFRTQALWRENGDIEAQLMQVLPPEVMRKVREKVRHDTKLDDIVAEDVSLAGKDHIDQTPSLVIDAKGKRQTLAAPPWAALKSYIEQLLAQ